MMRLFGSIVFVWFLLCSSLTRAAEPSAAPDPISIQSVSQMVVGLLLVIGLILFLAWALRRMNAVPGQNGKMRVIATLPLGVRERAVLVQIGEEQLLLGVTGRSVELLAKYESPIITPDAPVSGGDFAMKLAKALKRRGKN